MLKNLIKTDLWYVNGYRTVGAYSTKRLVILALSAEKK